MCFIQPLQTESMHAHRAAHTPAHKYVQTENAHRDIQIFADMTPTNQNTQEFLLKADT